MIIGMSSSFRRLIVGAFFCSLLLPVLGGCHYRGDSGLVAAPDGKVRFDRIAVVPFQQILPEDAADDVVHCPLCGTIIHAQRSSGNPEQVMERLFLAQLDRQKPKAAFMSGEKVAGVFQRVSASSLKMPLRQVLSEVGRELEAEGVVVGYVYRFRERKGVAYTVEQPASVTFDLHLLRVSDGALVWRGHFDKTQSSLMEDVFQLGAFFREKGRWVTAEELMDEGIEAVLETFPGL
ncbi:MAG: DUF4136 domain-containing protein [Deltaproteobacteria bacterium]|nr:DUF4136 domain-containing protein [Deltaproteobacteria bacterium]